MIDYQELRKEMGPGPWDAEPDRLEWRHQGVPCLIVRNQFGQLCGYAACPPGHPWHGRDFEDVPAEVHRGLTYAAACDVGGLICHDPLPGEPDSVWWVGFDCGHWMDLTPVVEGTLRRLKGNGQMGAYRDIPYVMRHCESLAEQILRAGER